MVEILVGSTFVLLFVLSAPGFFTGGWIGWERRAGRGKVGLATKVAGGVLLGAVLLATLLLSWPFVVIMFLGHAGLGIWGYFCGKALCANLSREPDEEEETEECLRPELQRDEASGLILSD